MTETRIKSENMRTLAIHAGEEPDKTTHASAPNIVMSTTFLADADASFSAEDFGDDTPFFYSRWGNPTVTQLEDKLAALEGAEAGIAFASGMAAVTALFLHTLKAGDHLIISDISYAATAELSHNLLPNLGIEVTRVDLSNIENLRGKIKDNTRLIYAENPANPILRLTDIEAVATISYERNIPFAVDATFATPVAVRPLSLGADYVIHSLTKYLGGHGDAIGGAVLGKKSDIALIRKNIAIRTGGIISPFNAWLIMRGLATLPIRMKAHEEGAFIVARFLEEHSKIKRVIYPGLPSHPQHDLAVRQMKNFSGMITFQVDDGQTCAKIFSKHLKIIHYAVSLGHHRSLIFYLPTQELLRTSFWLDDEQKRSFEEYAGDGIFRLSVGLEEPEDLCKDLDNALSLL
ncbi:MAG: PLP-dependent aspartate aminotransferase family protein [Methanospirillum sp.]|uniref:trans-sulfuration enzyme family protein n=1 Tax=Methanospirillum sp. TaxID=45200 RepID=UPI00236D41B4|nr:PLP-dependent aspartate aminotransferase family protein [Methanospirillum sp.]MDD1728801.1 PLP-dependent aspartate aminotransferase family protein [Methanospirillum sp.]